MRLIVFSLAIAAGIGAATVDAEARGRRQVTAALATPDIGRNALPMARPSAPMLAIISLDAQKLSLYSGGALIAQTSISSGMPGHATPTGVFSIIQKNKWHVSNIYSGAEMPFMQRITWSGIALHAGVIPGYPASHGCIRLPYAFAERLWGMTKLGVRVIVAPSEARVGTIEHPKLPTPTFVLEQANAVPTPATGANVAGSLARMLNPLERAQAEKIRAAADLNKSIADAREALEASRVASAEVEATVGTIRRAEAAIDAANARLASAHAYAEIATTEAAREQAERAENDAETELDRALFDLDEAKAARVALDVQAFEIARAARDAEMAKERAERANHLAARGTEPITVFISRKERKVFVRQGFEPIFEADVDIQDLDAPLGTHVLMATEPRDGGATMRWIAANVPGGAAHIETVERTGRTAVFGPAQRLTQVAHAPPASRVLDRVTIPDAALAFVAQRLWTGATLILSDHGLSSETGKGTDFVVLTK